MTAIVRAIHKVEIPDWYKNYSVLFITTIYLFLINFKVKPSIKWAVFAFSILYSVGIWYKSAEQNLPSYQLVKSTFEADVVNFQEHQYWSFLTAQEGIEFYQRHNQQTHQFIKKGWYKLPETPLTGLTFDSTKAEETSFAIEKSAENFATIIRYMPESIGDTDRKYKNRYGFIQSESTKQLYFFGMTPPFNGIKGIFKYKSLFFDMGAFGVNYKYYKEAIPAGNYRVGMLFINEDKKPEWKISEQTIQVDNY